MTAYPNQIPESLWGQIFDRICEATGTRTQMELADILGIRQSSISDAKRRRSIPREWFLKIWEKTGISPEWLEKGSGSKYLIPTNDNENNVTIREPYCRKCTIQAKFNEATSLLGRYIKIDKENDSGYNNSYVLWFENGALVNIFTFPKWNNETD